MPRPLSFLGSVIVSQEIRWIFLRPLVDPQMKFLVVCSMQSWIFLGILTYCIMWLGMLPREALARMVLPAIWRNLVFYPPSLVLRLSRMNWKSLAWGVYWKISNPRYLPNSLLYFIWRVEAMMILCSLEQLLKKIIFYLKLLTLWPEWWLKLLRVSKIIWHFFSSARAKRVRSSTKKKRFWGP